MPRLADVILRDVLANRPAANAVAEGALFFDTTNSVLYRSNGSSWQSVESAAASGASISQGTLAGRGASSGAGVYEEIALGSGLSLSGTTLSVSSTTDTTIPSEMNDFVDAETQMAPWEQFVAGDNVTFTELGDGNGIALQINATQPAIPASANGLLTGGNVLWTGGLAFLVSAATYRINGVDYASAQTTVTLSAADGTNDRIDAIIVNTSGVATKVDGTAAASPAAPSIDPESQILLTLVLVKANATTPSNISQQNIYLENAEWTTSTNAAARIDFAAVTDPYAGSKHIQLTASVANDTMTFTAPAGFALSDYNTLNFVIKNQAAWANAKSISITFLNSAASAAVGSVVTLDNGLFGFDHANTSVYQLISIPITSFNVGVTIVGGLKFTVVGSGAGITARFDNIILQGGSTQTTLPTGIMLFQGNWVSSKSYNVNDVVVFSDSTFIALISNTGSAPLDGSTWREIGFQNSRVEAPDTTAPFETSDLLNNTIDAIEFVVDGGGSAITTGVKGDITVPFNCTIFSNRVLADQSGSIVFDIWKDSLANFPPTVADTITASAKPTLSSATNSEDKTLTGWTLTINAGDTLRFNVDSASTVTRVTLALNVLR